MAKFYFFLVCSLLLVSCSSNSKKTDTAAKTTSPNILLIVVDDQGYADFDPFSHHDPAIKTPNMARLAKAGRIYPQAYVTAPVCSPSRAGLITGKNQFRWDKTASWGPGLPDSVKTVAEYLHVAGYQTARIGKNDLGQKFHRNDVREYPLHHGYDEFLGFSAHAHDYWLSSDAIKKITPDPFGTSALLGPLMHNMGEKSYDSGYLTEILTDESINFIKKPKKKPFFLTLSYNAVHHLIHQVPEDYLEKYDVAPIANYHPDSMLAYGKHPAGSYSAYYDKYSRLGDINQEDIRKYHRANLNYLDDQVGRVLDALESEEIADNTVIFYISDNGGSPLTGANNRPLTGGKYSLFEGGIRVPLAVVWPVKIQPGTVEKQYVSALDILPTIADVAGIKLSDTTLDGQSLLQTDPNRLLIWQWQKNWAVRRGDWKLTNAKENHWKSDPSLQYLKPIVDNNELKLFNVATDPGERIDLAAKNPEQVEALEKAYKKWMSDNQGNY